jgi:hypothetical protein
MQIGQVFNNTNDDTVVETTGLNSLQVKLKSNDNQEFWVNIDVFRTNYERTD